MLSFIEGCKEFLPTVSRFQSLHVYYTCKALLYMIVLLAGDNETNS